MDKQKYLVRCRRTKVEGLLIGVYQFSEVLEPSPLIGGHKGGVIAYPVALIETDKCFIQRKMVEIEKIGTQKGGFLYD